MELHPDLSAILEDQFDFACRLHAVRSLAPLAASMADDGEINGTALLADEEDLAASEVTADDAIGIFTERFAQAARAGAIRASAIFFHGYDSGEPPVLPAQDEDEANCIVALLDHRDGQAVYGVIGYARGADGEWVYAAPRFGFKRPLIFPAS